MIKRSPVCIAGSHRRPFARHNPLHFRLDQSECAMDVLGGRPGGWDGEDVSVRRSTGGREGLQH